MSLFAFNGTWNDDKDTGVYGQHTNVVEFYKRYRGAKNIFAGVGTRHGLLGKLWGGAFGAGAHDRVNEAVDIVMANEYAPVDIIGFSRGAAIAIHFANVLHGYGIKVRALLLFDLVAAFGIPIDIGGIPFNRWNIGYNLVMPRSVDACFHALAMDENRAAFDPTTIEGAYEVWFKGAHSDVGGGNENPNLSNIPLRWMLYQAHRLGLPIDAAAPGDLPYDHTADIKLRTSRLVKARYIGSGCRVHHTALKAGRPLVEYAPDPAPAM